MTETTEKRGRGRPRKKPIENVAQQKQIAPENPIQEKVNISVEPNKKYTNMDENSDAKIREVIRVNDLEKENARLKKDVENLTAQINDAKTNSQSAQTNFNAELEKVRKYAKELENKNEQLQNQIDSMTETESDDIDGLQEECDALEAKVEAYKKQVEDLTKKLDEAQKHAGEIEAQKTGKLIIPVNDFTRKCYLTWCDIYSKDSNWTDNYKQNVAQFEKWGLAPDMLNMPILMVLANMLGKIDSISFDCKIPAETVRKIAGDCKKQQNE